MHVVLAVGRPNARGETNVIDVEADHRSGRAEETNRGSLDGRVAPAMAINAATLIHRVHEVKNLGPLPPRHTSHIQLTLEEAVGGQRDERRLQPRRGDERKVRRERIEECVGGQPRDAHVLVDAHGVLVIVQRAEPNKRHEVTLMETRRTGMMS